MPLPAHPNSTVPGPEHTAGVLAGQMERHMRRIPFLILSTAALGLGTACTDPNRAPTAPAAAPSFNVTQGAQYKSVSTAISTASATLGNLLVSFDESGVGNAAGTTIERVVYHVDALFACKNGGSNWPTDPKKQGVSFSGAFQQEFANHGGRTTGTLSVPVPASTLSCPSGQRRTLVAIQWITGTNPFLQFRLEDVTNSVTFNLANIRATLDATYDLDTTLPQ